MMQSYYASFLDPKDTIEYGYVFRDRNIVNARLHCSSVAEQMNVWTLKVQRINNETRQRLAERYTLPTPIPEQFNEEDDDV